MKIFYLCFALFACAEANDCWKNKPVWKFSKPPAVSLITRLPGFGINVKATKKEAFSTVLKDGFFEVDCIKDSMVHTGDKHDKNKVDFANRGNVSIIYYHTLVPKEDREPITPLVCFNFCRTVPDAGFFGLIEGRKCYCAPYFKKAAGDSSECDAVCEGDNTQMCGGMKKSAVYAMHMCDAFEDDAADAIDHAGEASDTCDCVNSFFTDESENLQSLGEALKKGAGPNGDKIGAKIGQGAVVASGPANDIAKESGSAVEELEKLSGDIPETKPEKPEDMAKGEALIEKTNKFSLKATEMCTPHLDTFLLQCEAQGAQGDGDDEPVDYSDAVKQFYAIEYWVHKKDVDGEDVKYVDLADSTSVCDGEAVDHLTVNDEFECAEACNLAVGKCIAFNYFANGKDKHLCVLLGSVDEISYYAKPCKESLLQKPSPSFLQQELQHENEKRHLKHRRHYRRKKTTHKKTGKEVPDKHLVCAARFSDMKGFEARFRVKEGVKHVEVNKLDRKAHFC